MSEASRRRLLFLLRNGPVIQIHATFTYEAVFPTDAKTIRRHTALIRLWLVRHGCSGVWVREFQSRGAPHLHVLLTSRVDGTELSKAWAKIIGAGSTTNPLVHVARVKSPSRLINYVAKRTQQKQTPNTLTNVGRWWAAFGGYRTTPVATIVGSSKQIARIVRVAVRLLADTRPPWLPRFRDRGRNGITLFGVSKPLQKRLTDLLTLFGFSRSMSAPAIC